MMVDGEAMRLTKEDLMVSVRSYV